MTQRVVNYTYGTGNPVLPDGSIDVRDGIDNLQSFDIFMNASEDTYNQRDGEIVRTVSGMNNEFDTMIGGMNNEFDAQIMNMGFTRVGTFAAGATLTNPRQTLLWDIADGGDGQEYGWSGAFQKVVPATSTPASTGGISVGAWMSRFDPALKIIVFEALRRSYAEAGHDLIGTFSNAGLVVDDATDVVLWEPTGVAYAYSGTLPHTIGAGETPIANPLWVMSADVTLRGNLASKYGRDMLGGDLHSYGADKTGVTPCDAHLEDMLADGVFIVTSGTYLISTPHTIDVSLMDKISIGPNVEFLIRANINGLSFKNVLTDVIGNNMRITVDIPGGGYSGIALELRGTKYFAPPSGLGRLTNKTQFGPFYVFNKQGASKQEVATAPVMDEGYGFSIDCNSSDEEILIWNGVKVSSTGFTTAHSISVGTNHLNFISSLDLDLVAWFSTYHFRDSSQSVAGGNVAAGIGDVRVRLQSQPHHQMVKVVHMEHSPGYMSGCRFDLSIWDANVFGYRAGVVDASKDNEYSNTLERYSYPLTRALNVVDSSLFPVVNYRSGIQESDVVVSSDPELAKYLYLSTVTPSMTILEACNAIKEWCNTNGVKHTFEFRISLFSTTADIKATFLPWLSAIGDDAGTFTLKTSYYDGVINSISVVYELDTIASGGRREVHEIMWTNKSASVSHKLVAYGYGTTAEIKSKAPIMPKGFTTYDTTFNIPVWFNGSAAFVKADGAVAYPT